MTTPATCLKKDIYKQMLDDFRHNRLALPTLPDTAFKIRSALHEKDADADQLNKIVQNDPAVTARLIQIANSVMYRGHSNITSSKAAIVRLGLNTTRDLVTAYTLKQVFRSINVILREKMNALWHHSTQISALCYALATETRKFDAGMAMLIGLVHDIGAVPIIVNARQYPELLNHNLLDDTIRALRIPMTKLVLHRWGFDKQLIQAAVNAENWMRDHRLRADYGDLLVLAQLHSFVGTDKIYHYPLIHEVPAFAKIGNGELGPKSSLKILDDAKQTMKEAKELLGIVS